VRPAPLNFYTPGRRTCITYGFNDQLGELGDLQTLGRQIGEGATLKTSTKIAVPSLWSSTATPRDGLSEREREAGSRGFIPVAPCTFQKQTTPLPPTYLIVS
jgi:hypothetical protein